MQRQLPVMAGEDFREAFIERRDAVKREIAAPCGQQSDDLRRQGTHTVEREHAAAVSRERGGDGVAERR